jgi:hypothetical protein
MWSQRQGMHRLGLDAAANSQIRMAHERRAGLAAGAAIGRVVDSDGGRLDWTQRAAGKSRPLRDAATATPLRI